MITMFGSNLFLQLLTAATPIASDSLSASLMCFPVIYGERVVQTEEQKSDAFILSIHAETREAEDGWIEGKINRADVGLENDLLNALELTSGYVSRHENWPVTSTEIIIETKDAVGTTGILKTTFEGGKFRYIREGDDPLLPTIMGKCQTIPDTPSDIQIENEL